MPLLSKVDLAGAIAQIINPAALLATLSDKLGDVRLEGEVDVTLVAGDTRIPLLEDKTLSVPLGALLADALAKKENT